MNNEVKRRTEDLNKIKNSAQNIIDDIDKLLSFTSKDSKTNDEKDIFIKKLKDKDYELNAIEDEIIRFIGRNPGRSKEFIVQNINCSRVTGLKHTNELLKSNIIIYKKDINNANTHLLYLNQYESILVLISYLQAFQESYFNLIEKIELKDFSILLKDCRTNIKKIFFTEKDIVRILFAPFKIIMHVFQFYLLFNHLNYPTNSISITKSIIFDIFGEIRNKLFSSSMIYKIYDKYVKDLYFNYFDSIDSIPDIINEMLKIFRISKLDHEIEKVMDNLWKICVPVLPFIDPFFSRFTSKKLQNWKVIMNDFDSSLYSKKRNYNLLYNISSA